MKFINSSFILILVLIFSGCAHVPVDKMTLINTILTTGGDGERFKRKQHEGAFKTEDSILMLTTLRWPDIDSGAGIHTTKWNWYSNNELITIVERDFNFYQTPFELRGAVLGTIMGEGNHKVDLYIDDKLFDTQEFSVEN